MFAAQSQLNAASFFDAESRDPLLIYIYNKMNKEGMRFEKAVSTVSKTFLQLSKENARAYSITTSITPNVGLLFTIILTGPVNSFEKDGGSKGILKYLPEMLEIAYRKKVTLDIDICLSIQWKSAIEQLTRHSELMITKKANIHFADYAMECKCFCRKVDFIIDFIAKNSNKNLRVLNIEMKGSILGAPKHKIAQTIALCASRNKRKYPFIVSIEFLFPNMNHLQLVIYQINRLVNAANTVNNEA